MDKTAALTSQICAGKKNEMTKDENNTANEYRKERSDNMKYTTKKNKYFYLKNAKFSKCTVYQETQSHHNRLTIKITNCILMVN